MSTTFRLDLWQASRSIWKAPGFLVAAVLSLALGVGANVATFSVLRAALVPDVGWANPRQLMHVGRKDAEYPMLPDTLDVTPERHRLWQENQDALAPLAAYAVREGVLGGSIEPRTVVLTRVSPEFWATLGVQPLLGRLPEGEEEAALVASHRLWTSALGGDPMALGRSFAVAGRPYTLVGVLPPAAVWFGSEAFVPLALTEAERSGSVNFLQLVGRRRPGLGEAEVQAAFRTMNARLQAALPSEKSITAVPRPLLTLLNRRVRGGQELLAWVCFFLMALACVNLCTLALGRSASRFQELWTRQALGASPVQLFSPLFADLVVAAGPGLAMGWALWWACGRLLEAFLPATLRPFHRPSPEGFAVGMGAVLLMAAVGGGLPALLLRKPSVFGFSGGARMSPGPGRRWTQKGLVAVQVGLAVTLLSSFALVHRSVAQLKDAPIGIEAHGRLLASVSLPAESPAELARRQAEVAQVLEKVRALPGVEVAGGTDLLPVVSGGGYNGSLNLPGHAKPVFTYYRDASDGYFEAAGIPLLEGRTFRASDLADPPRVAIVSQSFARDYFPGESVVGRVVPIGALSLTLVGVVGDARMDDLRQSGDTQTFYTPFAARRLDLVVKVSGGEKAHLPELRRVLRAQWPDVSLDRLGSLPDALEQGRAAYQRRATLLGLLATLALLLTLIGIYGVLSRQVESRRHEMGIRMALGGRHSGIVALVLRESMGVVAFGLVAGVGGAAAAGHVIRSQLYQIQPLDPASHVFALLLLAATALLASLVPALKASRVEPLETLREP